MRVETVFPTEIPQRTAAPTGLMVPRALAEEFNCETKVWGLNGGRIIAACMSTWLRLHRPLEIATSDSPLRPRRFHLTSHAAALIEREAFRRRVSVSEVVCRLANALK